MKNKKKSLGEQIRAHDEKHYDKHEHCDCGHHCDHHEHHNHHACECHEHHHEHHHCDCGHAHVKENKTSIILIIVSAIITILSLFTIKEISYIAYIILIIPVIKTIWKNRKTTNIFDENLLMFIASVGALLLGETTEAVAVILFYRIGMLFQEKAIEKSHDRIHRAVDLRPDKVTKLENDKEIEILAKDVKIGDVLYVKPSEFIPVDGVVIKGSSRLDTSSITGESNPISVEKDCAVFSGSVNLDSAIFIQVTTELKDSLTSRILDSVENAKESKPKLEQFITKFSKIYTPIVLGIALFAIVFPTISFGNFKYWVYTALTFLVVSCPCALVLSIPLTYFAGIGAAAKKHILFKSGEALEGLAHVKVVALDKTGTLTTGKFNFIKFHNMSKLKDEDVLSIVLAMEKHSKHPLATALTTNKELLYKTKELSLTAKEIPGKGLKTVIKNVNFYCGTKAFLEENGILVKEISSDYTLMHIGYGKEYLGCIEVGDEIKSDSVITINKLQENKFETVLLTGDKKQAAEKVGNKLHINRVYSQLLPDQKLDCLKMLRNTFGPVMFVGDGMNDAPVLIGADIGAAMGSGTDVAIEAADIVYLTSDTRSISDSIKIAKQTNKIATQNIIIAIGCKLLVIVLGFMGHADLWMAVLADTGVAIICVLNAIRVFFKK